jgi:hypothetical protein
MGDSVRLNERFSLNASHIKKKSEENHHEKEGEFQPGTILLKCRLFDEPS